MVAPIRNKAIAVLIPTAVILITIGLGLYLIKTQFSRTTQASAAPTVLNIGSLVPNLTLEGNFSKNHFNPKKLSEVPEKILLLNFWASWCESCISEMPALVALHSQYHSKGFEILGINLDDNPGAVVPRIIKQFHIEFPIFQDPSNTLSELFNVHAIPLTVVLNQDRKVLLIENGDRDWNTPQIRDQLERWLSE